MSSRSHPKKPSTRNPIDEADDYDEASLTRITGTAFPGNVAAKASMSVEDKRAAREQYMPHYLCSYHIVLSIM